MNQMLHNWSSKQQGAATRRCCTASRALAHLARRQHKHKHLGAASSGRDFKNKMKRKKKNSLQLGLDLYSIVYNNA